MGNPTTAAGRTLLRAHPEKTSWPSIRNDPGAGPDGYLHYCGNCHTERRYPCSILVAAAAIEAEARSLVIAEIRAGIEGLHVVPSQLLRDGQDPYALWLAAVDSTKVGLLALLDRLEGQS